MIAFAFASLLHVSPCTAGDSKKPATCGTYTVYEDRSAKSGRTIAIHFIDIKAKHPSHRAIVFNPGGPGGSAIEIGEGFADAPSSSAFAKLHDTYDILLVDNRGTGQSALLDCEIAPAAHPEMYFRQLWPDALIKSCHDKLAAKANLSAYITNYAVDDLDDIRGALGYPKLVLFGGSYGTTFYLAYARAHPEHVESLILQGNAPPHYYIIPLAMAGGAQAGIDSLIAACKAEASCAKHFPDFAAHFEAVIHRFDNGPVSVPVRNAVTKKMQNVALSKEVLVDRLRQALYDPGHARYVPVEIERAYSGNYGPLAEMVDDTSQLFDHITPAGLNLSVTCAEDLPFVTESDIVTTSANSFEGDLRARAQQRACKIWNVQPAPASFVEPVKSDLPMLMMNGTGDPATPPKYAQAALQDLPNARLMLIPGATHDSDFPPCADAAILAFVRAGTAKGLDLDHCGSTYRLPKFATLAMDESAPGENVVQTRRFRAFVANVFSGKIDRSQLTPDLSKQYPDSLVKTFASAGLGDLNGMIFKGKETTSKGVKYTYLAKFDNGNANASFVLDKANRIGAMDVTPL